ncbi:MAG: hypothetical protein NZ585_09215 [Chloracidobacterium sp.]|nr:hypothetical protein [Chloracidobacterium sp.]MDW8217042.1 hypothetical protein [Acidobacteriota bacterium]
MSLTEAVVQGTLYEDGTLQLNEKPNLPSGRVQVILRRLPETLADDPFWQRMQAIWAIPRSGTEDGGEQSLEEARLEREAWEAGQRELERLQGIEHS